MAELTLTDNGKTTDIKFILTCSSTTEEFIECPQAYLFATREDAAHHMYGAMDKIIDALCDGMDSVERAHFKEHDINQYRGWLGATLDWENHHFRWEILDLDTVVGCNGKQQRFNQIDKA